MHAAGLPDGSRLPDRALNWISCYTNQLGGQPTTMKLPQQEENIGNLPLDSAINFRRATADGRIAPSSISVGSARPRNMEQTHAQPGIVNGQGTILLRLAQGSCPTQQGRLIPGTEGTVRTMGVLRSNI